MSRAIHLSSTTTEKSLVYDWLRSGEKGGGVPQRIHVALPHYAAVRRRAALRQKGAPQTDTGATMPAKSGCGNGGGCLHYYYPTATNEGFMGL